MLLLSNVLTVDNPHPCCHNQWLLMQFFCSSIEHMIWFLSVFEFLINPSYNFPCNFLQIDVLYHGPTDIHYELCLYISYCKCSWVSIIHNIPTWCNILFNAKVVIIYWYVVSNIPTSILVSSSQLLHLIAIFTPVCFISSSLGLYQHYILNIENSFNNYGNSFYHYLSCLQWTPWYQKKGTNWDFPSCLLASIKFYHYNQCFL